MRTSSVEFQGSDRARDGLEVPNLVPGSNIPQDDLAVRRASCDVVHVGMELHGFDIVQVASLPGEDSQRLVILKDP